MFLERLVVNCWHSGRSQSSARCMAAEILANSQNRNSMRRAQQTLGLTSLGDQAEFDKGLAVFGSSLKPPYKSRLVLLLLFENL
jgi:hypothetical protein